MATVGDTIRFVWSSGVHSVASGVTGQHVPALGDLGSPVVSAPGTWDYEAKEAGTFPYTCRLHPSMEGVLRVAAGGPASTAEGNVVVLAEGYKAEVVTTGHPFATSLAFRGGKLLLLEAGRCHYAEPWYGHATGGSRR